MTLHHVMQPYLIPHEGWIYLQAPLFGAAFALPSRTTLALAIVACMAMFYAQAPAVWSQCWWVMQTDLLLVGTMPLCPADAVIKHCSVGIQKIMGVLYLGAGFWKLNTAFLDPRVSCAHIFTASLATRLPEWLTPPWLLRTVLVCSPQLILLGELGPGVCLLLPSRAAQRLGVLLVCALHYAIAITPYPNAISQFGVLCVTRMFFVLPEAYTAALAEAVALPSSAAGVAARGAAAAFVAYTAACTDSPHVRFVSWDMPAVAVLCVIALRAVIIDTWGRDHLASSTASRAASAGKVGGPGPRRMLLMRAGGALGVAVALLYSFGGHLLGLTDMSAVSPFSMLAKPVSNHLLVPHVSMLQRWEATAKWDLFRGGVVRVTACTSDYLNALYPGNTTGALPLRVRAMLHAAGHLGQQFRPTPRRMLGPRIRAFMPRWRPGEPFPAYTVPALELRRMLAEVRAVNESFTIEYERLPGLEGDERWRQTAVASTVRLREDGAGGRTCEARPAGAHVWEGCAADELANMPPPEGPLMKLMLALPQPILPGLTELPCIQ